MRVDFFWVVDKSVNIFYFNLTEFPFGLDLAAINIQRGRDHGLPSYTSWRGPCGLSEINSWDDLELVVGPRSMERIRQAYRIVDDIDIFVGGLAERPVIGGLVGPTFSCIIAQQFSNIRRGDRFWYENPGFESSFTPAQLQSIRQVTLAQIICRQLGGGTLQPNVMLPHTVFGNDRKLCGVGLMAGIDLLPWTERDPFNRNKENQPKPFSSLIHSHTNFDQKKPTIIHVPDNDSTHNTDKDGIDTIFDIFDDDSDEDDDSNDDKTTNDSDEENETDNGILDKLDINQHIQHITGSTVDTKLDFFGNKNSKKPGLTTESLNNKNDLTIHPVDQLITTNSKLDFKKASITNKRTTTKRPTTQVILITPPTNREKLKKLTTTTTTTTAAPKRKRTTRPKRPTKTKIIANRRIDDFMADDDLEPRETEQQLIFFLNEDNATSYEHNRAVNKITNEKTPTMTEERTIHNPTAIRKIVFTTPSPDSYRVEINIEKNSQVSFSPYQFHNNFPSSNNFQVNSNPYYTYNYPQSYQYPPVHYPQNQYPQGQYPPSNFQSSTPFSYNTDEILTENIYEKYQTQPNKTLSIFSSHASHSSNKNISVHNHLPSNFYDKTTRKPELQTYFTVDTTAKTTPVPYITRPLGQTGQSTTQKKKPQQRPASTVQRPTGELNVFANNGLNQRPTFGNINLKPTLVQENRPNTGYGQTQGQNYHPKPGFVQSLSHTHNQNNFDSNGQYSSIQNTNYAYTPNTQNYGTNDGQVHSDSFNSQGIQLNNGQTFGQIITNSYGHNLPNPMLDSKTIFSSLKSKTNRRRDTDIYDTTDPTQKSVTIDYDYNTQSPIHNEKYNNDDYELESRSSQFDLDGYLRPDMMTFHPSIPIINSLQNISTKLSFPSFVSSSVEASHTSHDHDDYVLPRLSKRKDFTTFSTKSATQHQTTASEPIHGLKINDKLDSFYVDSLPRRPTFDILSTDYDNDDITDGDAKIPTRYTNAIKLEGRMQHEISIVPIKILTDPNR